MTHTDLLRQSLDALELQEPAVGCPREREHWKRTAMPTIAALRAALAAPVEPVRELLIQAAALAVVAERQGKYPGAAQVADEVLKAQPAIDGFGGNLDSAFDAAPAVPAVDCRTCARCYSTKGRGVFGCDSVVACTNGDRYQPLPPVKLWRTT